MANPWEKPEFENTDAMLGPLQMTEVADYAEYYGNVAKGDTAARSARLTDLDEDQFFWDTTLKAMFRKSSGTWVAVQGDLSKQASGASISGIVVPSGSIPAGTLPLIKTGFAHAFATAAFGHGYMPTVTFTTPFPTGCTGLSITQVFAGSIGSVPVLAIDILNNTSFRIMFPADPSLAERAYVWTAVGY